MTEHLFFAIINAEKGIVTRCVENGRLQRKKRGVFMEKTFQTGSFSFRLRFPEELVLNRSADAIREYVNRKF